MNKLNAKGRHNAVAAIATSFGEISAIGGQLASGTITITGNVSASGASPFVPEYNGAQSPTIVAFSESSWDYFDFGFGSSDADADHEIYFMATTPTLPWPIPYVPNGEIWTVGDISGSDIDNGSAAWPLTNIFSLMQNPDTVKIRLVSAAYVDDDHGSYPSTVVKIGTFTDNVAFAPVDYVHYGYMANSNVTALAPPDSQLSGQITPIVEFTFNKVGFAELIVTYKVESFASAQAEESQEEPGE